MTLRMRIGSGLMAVVLVAVLAGCALVRPVSLKDLEGTWVYRGVDGTSTMVIDDEGRFTIDQAPSEAFDLSVNTGIKGWDGRVDWDRARPMSGELVIGDKGSLSMNVAGPREWDGNALPRLSSFWRYISFSVGDRDYSRFLRYEKQPQ